MDFFFLSETEALYECVWLSLNSIVCLNEWNLQITSSDLYRWPEREQGKWKIVGTMRERPLVYSAVRDLPAVRIRSRDDSLSSLASLLPDHTTLDTRQKKSCVERLSMCLWFVSGSQGGSRGWCQTQGTRKNTWRVLYFRESSALHKVRNKQA